MPADIAGGLGAVALFAAPGYGLTAFLPVLRRKPPARRMAYGYLLGVAWLAGMLYALSHFLAVPLRPPAVWTLAAVPVLAGAAAAILRRRRRRQPPLPHPGPRPRWLQRLARSEPRGTPAADPQNLSIRSIHSSRSIHQPAMWFAARLRRLGGPLAAAALAIAAIICLAVFAEAISDPVNDWDGRMTWGAQARFIRQAGTVDAAVLRQPQWFITHPQYPLLLPVAQTAVREAFRADPDAPLPRALYAAFLPAFLLVLYDGARRAGGARAAALVVLVIAITPYMLLGAGAAATTYNDLPLAALYGGALVLLLAPRPRADSGLAAGLLLAAAVLAKNEGTLLALVALAVGWRTAHPRATPTPPGPPSLSLAPGVPGVPGAPSLPVLPGPLSLPTPPSAPGTPNLPSISGAPSPSIPPIPPIPPVPPIPPGAPSVTISSGAPAPAGTPRLPAVPVATQPAAPPPSRRASTALPAHLRRFLAAAVPVLLAVALLTSWRADIVNRQDDAYPQLLRAAQLWPGLLTQPAAFAPVLLATMFSLDLWARFWWMVPAVLIAGRRALRHPRNRRFLLAAAAPLTIAWAAYTVHPQPAELAAVSWNRILLQASLPLLIVLAGALAAVGRPWRRLLTRRHAGER